VREVREEGGGGWCGTEKGNSLEAGSFDRRKKFSHGYLLDYPILLHLVGSIGGSTGRSPADRQVRGKIECPRIPELLYTEIPARET